MKAPNTFNECYLSSLIKYANITKTVIYSIAFKLRVYPITKLWALERVGWNHVFIFPCLLILYIIQTPVHRKLAMNVAWMKNEWRVEQGSTTIYCWLEDSWTTRLKCEMCLIFDSEISFLKLYPNEIIGFSTKIYF